MIAQSCVYMCIDHCSKLLSEPRLGTFHNVDITAKLYNSKYGQLLATLTLVQDASEQGSFTFLTQFGI